MTTKRRPLHAPAIILIIITVIIALIIVITIKITIVIVINLIGEGCYVPLLSPPPSTLFLDSL